MAMARQWAGVAAQRRAQAKRLPHWQMAKRAQGRRPGPTPHMGITAGLMLLLLVGSVALLTAFTALNTVLGWYNQITRDLPSAGQLAARPVFQTTQIYDRHGTLLHEIYDRQG